VDAEGNESAANISSFDEHHRIFETDGHQSYEQSCHLVGSSRVVVDLWAAMPEKNDHLGCLFVLS
jgi:hypothetical protein